MTYILTLVMEEHSGVIRSKVKVDRLNRPYWKSDQVVMGVYLAVAIVIIVLLFGKLFTLVIHMNIILFLVHLFVFSPYTEIFSAVNIENLI